ncbi:MAG: CpeR family transcriptional regulator [Cyanobacteria bacterium P01_H01_bin.15]
MPTKSPPNLPEFSPTCVSMLLPPNAEKKMQGWIRSRHLICSGNFFVFETVDLGTIDRFSECVTVLGGTVITVDPVDKIWMGNHRQVLLYRVKASLHTPHHALKQYWHKFGGYRSRFACEP